jgi:hypothetical protein
MARTTKTPIEVAKASAEATFRAETKKATPEVLRVGLSPANATKVAAAKSGIPASRLVPVVAAIYYRGNGLANPVAKRGSLAAAVAKARDAGGRLARWEVLSYRFAAYGRETIPVASLRALYSKAPASIGLDRSYTGRGTRAGAVATRTDEVAETGAEVATG